MPRLARVVIPETPHHITQRGNNRQDVFFTVDDRRAYLKILAAQARRFGLLIVAYCLMTNHVHLIVIPRRADVLAKALGRAHWLYSQYVNRLHRRSGHLWQNRFFSCALGRRHAVLAARYVEQNPLRARLCRDAAAWPWSSARAHCSGIDPSGLLDLQAWRAMHGGEDWDQQLRQRLDERELRQVRRAWSTGRPLASDRWLAKLEAKLGRRLRPLPVGRPKKQNAKRTTAKRKRTTRSGDPTPRK
jgi:putative transposase